MNKSAAATDRDNPALTDGEPIGFAEAMSELNGIVADLESDTLDVDVLADRVERAAFLVGMCRDRLDATKLRVEKIIVRLDGSDDAGDTASDPAGDSDDSDDSGDSVVD